MLFILLEAAGAVYHLRIPKPNILHMGPQTLTIDKALPGFVDYMKADRQYAPGTIDRYLEGIQFFSTVVGNRALSEISPQDFVALKSALQQRGAQASRIAGIVASVKSLLRYTQEVLQLPILDLAKVRGPRVPRKQVVYLTPEELARFVDVIPLQRPWSDRPTVSGYCVRALVELLAASAMRISEALALNRDSIDFQKREASIIGKGRKSRTVFFTENALDWVNRYLALRADRDPALFATNRGYRMSSATAQKLFARASARAGLEKRVTPHILRHTAATNLLRNGCPIGFIKEILGHDRLETTCHYYLGVLNKAETKGAFDSYMR